VTIPVEMRRALGLEPGDKVEFTREGDRIVLSRPRSVVAETAGALAAYAVGVSWSDDDWDRTIGEAIAEDYRMKLEEALREQGAQSGDGSPE